MWKEDEKVMTIKYKLYTFHESGKKSGCVTLHPLNRYPSNNVAQKLIPDRKVRGANMRLTWDRQDPGGPRVGPTNLAIWDGGITNADFIEIS